MAVPTSLLSSPLFTIKETAWAGRGVFANRYITKGTLLFETPEVAASVIYREYRKEVCIQCFKYDRGRVWKIRLAKAGIAFCSESCQKEWTNNPHNDEEAFIAIEGLGKTGRTESSDSEDDAAQTAPRPTVKGVEAAWVEAEEKAMILLALEQDRLEAERLRTLSHWAVNYHQIEHEI